MKRNILNEVNRMREIMGLLNEQDEKKLTLPFQKTFKAGYWKLSSEVKSEIDSLINQVKSFVEKHTGNVIRLTVNSGESQITNFDREQNPAVQVEQGYLSDKRYETILNYLKQTYPNLLKNLEVEKKLIVGQTPYDKNEFAQKCGSKGQNRDSEECKTFFKKYEPEQFINFTIEVVGQKTPETTPPVVESPLCGITIGGRGKQGTSENDFISINKTVNTKGIPGNFTSTITSYAIPDRTQIYGVKNDGSKVILVDTGYFGLSKTRDDNVGGLTYHYHTKKDSKAFKSTDLFKMPIKTYTEPIELLRDVYRNNSETLERINNGYERRKDNNRELEDFYERYLNNVAKNYPKEYSLWTLWNKKKYREFVLFDDQKREISKNFMIDNSYKQLQVFVYGPLKETVSRVKLTC